jgi:hypothetical protein
VALWPNPHEGEIAKASVLMGRPIQGSHPINDVVYRIQKNPRSRMMVVHLDWLATYQGAARDERT